MKLRKENGKYITTGGLTNNVRVWDTLEDAFNFIKIMA